MNGIAKCIDGNGISRILSIGDGSSIAYSNRDKQPIYIQPTVDRKICDLNINPINNNMINNSVIANEFVINAYNVILRPNTPKNLPDSYLNIKTETVSPPFFQKFIDVVDLNNTNKPISKYLQYGTDMGGKITIQAYVEGTQKLFNKGRSTIPISIKRSKESIIPMDTCNVQPIKVTNTVDNYNIDFTEIVIPIRNISANKFKNLDLIPPFTIKVENSAPPTIGSTSNNSGTMRGFRIEMQKNSYFEQSILFNDKNVTDITGLPQGMIVEKGYLKGIPLLSGNYNIVIKMDDNSTLSGLIIVSQLPRKL